MYEAGILCGLAMLAALLVLPIIALVKVLTAGRRIAQLEQRVWQLQQQLESREVVTLQPVEPPPIPTLAPEASGVSSPQAPAPIPAAARAPMPPPIPTAARRGIDIEAWLGGRALGWIAVVLMLLAAAFFLRELYDRDLIGPLGRVAIAMAFGLALCIAGRQFYVRGWSIFSQMLTSAGVVVLYLATFASFGYYQLMEKDHAGIYLIVLVATTFGLALVYNAPAIAIMAVVGALLNPILLHSDRDQYVSLFTYLTVMNGAVVVLLLLRRWPAVSLVMLLGTQVVFWGWFTQSYHPEKRQACLIFQGGLFALWLVHHLRGPLHRFAASVPEDWIRWIVQALGLATSMYMMLEPDFGQWLGSMALGMAILYTLLLRYAFARRPNDPAQLAVLLALAMSFVAVVFPLEARTEWIPVGWAVQGLVLWWFGVRVPITIVRAIAAVLLGMGWFTWLVGQTLGGFSGKMLPHERPFVPFFNAYGLPSLTIAACLLTAAVMMRRVKTSPRSAEFILARIAGIAGIFTLWVLCSVEAYDWFMVKTLNPREFLMTTSERELDMNQQRYIEMNRVDACIRAARVALSITWALFAMALLALGLRLPSRPLRWMALALLGVTLIKVLVVDTEHLRGMYRVAAFFVLAMVMGAAAWGYQRLKGVLLATDQEKADADPI